MARIRTIKPDFFLDEKIAELKYESRLAFIGLWLLADRAGRLKDEVKKIKAQIFPYDELDMELLLKDLAKRNLITRYQLDKKYIRINNFLLHQKPHHTEKASLIPDLNGEITVNEPLKDGECQVGREGKGREYSNGGQKAHELIKTYCELFKERYKKNPVITAKDSGIAKRIANLPLEVPLSLVLQKFFDSKDKFIVQNRHSLNILESQINKLLVDKEDWRDG